MDNEMLRMLKTFDELIKELNKELKETHDAIAPYIDDKRYINRFISFNNNWTSCSISASRMAKAGFYFVGPNKRVQCAFCSTIFQGWKSGRTDPSIVHKERVPNCEYFTKSDDIFVWDRILYFIQSVGILPVIQGKYQMLTTVEDRIKTFDKNKKKLSMDLITICKAGFFFEVSSEKDEFIKCFCCEFSIDNFENEDTIWKLHAEKSPLCTFLLLTKGKEFVMGEHGGFYNIPEINYEDFLSVVNHLKSDLNIIIHTITNKPTKDIKTLLYCNNYFIGMRL